MDLSDRFIKKINGIPAYFIKVDIFQQLIYNIFHKYNLPFYQY